MRGTVWKVGLLAPLLLAACAPTAGPPTASPGAPVSPGATSSGAPSLSPGGPGATPVKPTPTLNLPAPSPGDEDGLRVVVDDGAGRSTTWTLTCDPPGGDHPNPTAACAAMESGAASLPPVPPDQMCTQVFGGPETAVVTGSWRGEAVQASFSRTNGCEISRWDALVPLLPAAGS